MPLHSGAAPRWLFDRMVDLGGAIAEAVIAEYGREELLRRLADPYWFQALGCVLGFDWHSSGVTTTTMGALKEALDPETHGVFVAGGKGRTSRATPDEIDAARIDLSGGTRARLADHSRLSATVDDACVQDTYTLYHHTMVVTEDGDWCVIQQGMNDRTARRYHWLSESVEDFVVEPQAAICDDVTAGGVLDLTAGESEEVRAVAVDLVQDDPSRLKRYAKSPDQSSLAAFGAGTAEGNGSAAPAAAGGALPSDALGHSDQGRHGAGPGRALQMPDKHALRLEDLTERSVDQLQRAYEYQPADFEELVGLEGIGAGSLRALALVAEVVHGADPSRTDPAKYAYAHGGKDGTPQPVDRERYDRSIDVLRTTLQSAETDDDTRQSALDRLAELTDDGGPDERRQGP